MWPGRVELKGEEYRRKPSTAHPGLATLPGSLAPESDAPTCEVRTGRAMISPEMKGLGSAARACRLSPASTPLEARRNKHLSIGVFWALCPVLPLESHSSARVGHSISSTNNSFPHLSRGDSNRVFFPRRADQGDAEQAKRQSKQKLAGQERGAMVQQQGQHRSVSLRLHLKS